MRLSRGLLVASAAFGALSVGAALTSADQASLQCGVLMLVSLAGYAAASKASTPRVRWGLSAGLALFAAIAAARLLWYGDRAADRDRVAGGAFDSTFYEQWRQTIDQERSVAIGLLLGILCLAVAVLDLPDRGRVRRSVVTTIVALLMTALVGRAVLGHARLARLGDLAAALWPALLAAALAAGLLAVSGRYADRTWLLPIGALLVASAAAGSLDDLAGAWYAWWLSVHPPENVAVVMGVRVSGSEGPQWSAAWKTFVALAGPALFTRGVLHSRQATNDREELV